MKKLSFYLFLTLLFVLTLFFKAYADDINWIEGPTTVPIADKVATLYLPANYVFADSENAVKYLQNNNVSVSGKEAGIIMSADPDEQWFLVLQYQDIGYFKEGKFDNINAKGFIDGMKMRNEMSKKETHNSLTPSIEITGYEEEPVYNKDNHSLKTAINIKLGQLDLINYLTIFFGRNGAINASLVCNQDEFSQLKNKIDSVLENVKFNYGYTYSDFDPAKDKLAFSEGSDFLSYLSKTKDNAQKNTGQKESDVNENPDTSKTKKANKTFSPDIPIPAVVFIVVILMALAYQFLKKFNEEH